MQRAIAYIRVSDPRQVDLGNSLQTQEKQVRAYAEAKGHLIDRLFTEEGESAKTDARPRLQEMLRWCRANKGRVSVLIVPKIDRLARHSFDYSSIKMALSKSGVRIESVGERIEDSPVGRFTESIMASVAQFDNEMRSERSKGGMIEAVIEGRWVWKAPIGYRNVRLNGKGTIEPHPTHCSLVCHAFEQVARGEYSIDLIRQGMAEGGIRLSRTRLYRMLCSKAYIGQIEAFGQIYQGKTPFIPIVSEATFYAARARLKRRQDRRHYQLQHPDFPLRGTVLCTCGKFLTAGWSKGKLSRYGYYRCLSCNRSNHRREDVEEAFARELESYRPPESRWNEIINALKLRSNERQALVAKDDDVLRREIKKLTELQGALAIKNASGVIPDALASKQIEALASKIDLLSEQLHADSQPATIDELLKFARWFFDSISFVWKEISVTKQQELQKILFPYGLIYDPTFGFRTPDNSLVGALNRDLYDDEYSLVDPNSEFTKNFLDLALRLYEIFQHENSFEGSYDESRLADVSVSQVRSRFGVTRRDVA